MTSSKIFLGDCLEILKGFSDNSIDLVMTSPPYADRRAIKIDPKNYSSWFIPIADQLYRVLKPTGSFILNIKENVSNTERDTYVIELILEMRKSKWLWTEEYIWCKTNSVPGKWPNRFRDSWERCLHFTKEKHFKMNQESVMIPIGDWAESRLKQLDKNETRHDSRTNSGFGRDLSKWINRDKVYPSNVLHLAVEGKNKNHSAVFPITLPTWFIKLFTNEEDIVLDPFLGSGTTALAAKQLNRKYIGIEIDPEYYSLAMQRVGDNSNDSTR